MSDLSIEPGLKSIFVVKLIVVLNFCILINNKLTPVQKNLKRLDFDKICFTQALTPVSTSNPLTLLNIFR